MIHRNLIDHLKTILVILVAGDGKEISLALSVSNYKYQLSAKITAIDREGKLCILRIFVYLLEYSSLLFINTDFLSVTIQIYEHCITRYRLQKYLDRPLAVALCR